MIEERWPPIYDLDGLLKQIQKIGNLSELPGAFFSSISTPDLCQGDIIRFEADFPYVDADGDVAVDENLDNLWVFVGNTCDFSRITGDFPFTHISPLLKVPDDISENFRTGLRQYSTYKRFFIPPWERPTREPGFFMEFPKMCSVEREGLAGKTTVLARMNRVSWLLFHSCLVRYLARDDGRNDPD